MYERALAGRFNTEGLRAQVLDDLGKARRNEFRAEPRPDPEPLPPGADAAAAAGREGGGVTERQPATSGDSGPAVDLFKGKLAHMMVGWPPPMLAGDVFDAPTSERTRAFQQACGLEQTGEADAPTWHALDSFTKADVPFSVVGPLLARAKVVHRASLEDPAAAASLPMWEAISGEAKALGLVEIEKHLEVDIGHAHHALSHFPEAAMHYENYLTRTIPNPPDYGMALELLRRAHRGEPTH